MNKHILKVNEKDFNEALDRWLKGDSDANILGFKRFFYVWEVMEHKKLNTGYIHRPIKIYVACDNTDGNFWVEEFRTLHSCINWLNDQY